MSGRYHRPPTRHFVILEKQVSESRPSVGQIDHQDADSEWRAQHRDRHEPDIAQFRHAALQESCPHSQVAAKPTDEEHQDEVEDDGVLLNHIKRVSWVRAKPWSVPYLLFRSEKINLSPFLCCRH